MCSCDSTSSSLVVPPTFFRRTTQEEEDLRDPELTERTGGNFPVVFRNVRITGDGHLSGDLSISDIKEGLPSSSQNISFDEIEPDLMFGGSLWLTLRFWDSVDVGLLFGFVTGSFDAEENFSGTVVFGAGGGHGGGGPETVNDTFDLSGDLTIYRFGLAPVFGDWNFLDGAIDLQLSAAVGAFHVRLSDMEVKAKGGVVEPFSVSDDSLWGGFIGPIARGSWRFSKEWSLDFTAQLFWLVGDAQGWSANLGIGIRLDL